MIGFLREQAEEWRAQNPTLQGIVVWDFIDWLESTDASPWRGAEEGLPKTSSKKWYLVKARYGYIACQRQKHSDWEKLGITHWQPIEQQP